MESLWGMRMERIETPVTLVKSGAVILKWVVWLLGEVEEMSGIRVGVVVGRVGDFPV